MVRAALLVVLLALTGSAAHEEPIPAVRSYVSPRALGDDLARAGLCRGVPTPSASGSGGWTCRSLSGGNLAWDVYGPLDLVDVERIGGCELDGPRWVVYTATRVMAEATRRVLGGTISC
jgi:hypothetical protein